MLNISQSTLQALVKQFKREYPEEFEVLKYVLDKWKGIVLLSAKQHGKDVMFTISSPKKSRKFLHWYVSNGEIHLGHSAQKTQEELCKLLDPADEPEV